MNETTIDKLNPATWTRTGANTSDGSAVLINPATGGECVMPPAHWMNPHIPRGVTVYEMELDARVRSEAPAMVEVLRKLEEVVRKSEMTCRDPVCPYCAMGANARAILARIYGQDGI